MRQACEIEGWGAAFTPLQRAKAGELGIIPETLQARSDYRTESLTLRERRRAVAVAIDASRGRRRWSFVATMTPHTATEQREFWKLKFLEGKWRWAAFLAIYFTSGVSGLFLPRLFGAPSAYPGSDPPWYFIRQDFFQGVGHLVGMFAVLVILAFTWRRYTVTNWFLVIMVSAIWLTTPVILVGLVFGGWSAVRYKHQRARADRNRLIAWSSSGASGRVNRNGPSSAARNSPSVLRTRRSVFPNDTATVNRPEVDCLGILC